MKSRNPATAATATAADLANEIRALPAVVALEAANANLTTLDTRLREIDAAVADAEYRAGLPRAADDSHRADVAALVVGAPRITPSGPPPLSPAALAALRDERAVVAAAIREQSRVIAAKLSPEARRAVGEYVRPLAIADLKRARAAVLSFDAEIDGTSRVRDALEIVGFVGSSAAPSQIPQKFDARSSGQDGLKTSERIQLEIENLEKHGTSNPAPAAPPRKSRAESAAPAEVVY